MIEIGSMYAFHEVEVWFCRSFLDYCLLLLWENFKQLEFICNRLLEYMFIKENKLL